MVKVKKSGKVKSDGSESALPNDKNTQVFKSDKSESELLEELNKINKKIEELLKNFDGNENKLLKLEEKRRKIFEIIKERKKGVKKVNEEINDELMDEILRKDLES